MLGKEERRVMRISERRAIIAWIEVGERRLAGMMRLRVESSATELRVES
jgi:hypothetical protein